MTDLRDVVFAVRSPVETGAALRHGALHRASGNDVMLRERNEVTVLVDHEPFFVGIIHRAPGQVRNPFLVERIDVGRDLLKPHVVPRPAPDPVSGVFARGAQVRMPSQASCAYRGGEALTGLIGARETP